VPEEFDPTGGNVAVTASFTIEGAAPSVEVCSAAGVAYVKLRIWEQYPGGTSYSEDAWLVACPTGVVTTEAVLQPGTYRVALYAVSLDTDADAAVPSADEPIDPSMISTSDVAFADIAVVTSEGSALTVSLDLSAQMGEE
tara:strand:- start:4482 stop:4901 length:420 start_codon:yes stop_codon:yes gene_type:complete